MTILADEHARIAARVIHEEARARAREHVVVALSGAHAYGFPSPDSDVDLKAIHLASTRALLGLAAPPATHDRLEVLEGVEIDYTSNELALAVRGLSQGNGNFLERVLGKHLLATGPHLAELASLARATLSRRYHRHYHGFARQQLAAFERATAKTAKQVLYVLRCALTGAHLLRTGELRVDLRDNLADYGFEDADALIAQKRAGERVVLGPSDAAYWQARLARAFEALARAHADSPLPEEPPQQPDLSAWLIDVRVRALAEHPA